MVEGEIDEQELYFDDPRLVTIGIAATMSSHIDTRLDAARFGQQGNAKIQSHIHKATNPSRMPTTQRC